MKNKLYQEIIENYIKAYNSFDIDKMLSDMHEDIKFENLSNGEINLTTNGIAEFRNQAEQAKQLFKEREQKIIDIRFNNEQIEIAVDYSGTLAVGLPNGLKAGNIIELKGKSIFKFEDSKIIELKDIS
ncbi:MAG: nuclear transport factor 2 family protein [Bacteroidales bacterium]|nr:nuclear transport factor 2 family protein [Bacteroidales bacterium]